MNVPGGIQIEYARPDFMLDLDHVPPCEHSNGRLLDDQHGRMPARRQWENGF
jgi:hypothetical protein